MPAGIICGFVKSRPELDQPDLQYHIAHATFANPHKRVFDKFPGITIGPCQLRPESRGYVHATSPDMTAKPDIQPNFLATRTDCEVHVAGLKIGRQLMATSIMGPHAAQELSPGIETDDDEALLAHARATGATLYHPVGTCKMGIDKMAVVDPSLKVVGLEGLRVVDASVMPNLISGNTNAPTMMIAEKASDMILADAR